MSDHEMNTLPGKIPIKTIIRGIHSSHVLFRQRAALNFPPNSFIDDIMDNQREKYFNKHYE